NLGGVNSAELGANGRKTTNNNRLAKTHCDSPRSLLSEQHQSKSVALSNPSTADQQDANSGAGRAEPHPA
ncbi:MAG: hypothetical protein P1U77_04610, partial [Rubripirellula sp.]|nr:hypothetical protein [Rubripirellula sp.]